MRFFLDENFPRPAITFLESASHSASHALQSFPPGTEDSELFACAQEQKAIFVTTDKDFFHTIPLAFEHHSGAIVITLRKPNRADLLRRLADVLTLLGERDLGDTVWLVTETHICSRPGGDVVFRWETSRAAACLNNIIPMGFTGVVQCDGYPAYRAFADSRNGRIQLSGCWAHARRKFHEALEQSPRTAAWILGQIQQLYAVEAALRQQRAGPRLRAARRAHQSRPVIQRLERALLQLKASRRHLPQSLMGQAIDYAMGQWPTLAVYLDQGRLEIDNNLVENAIRPTAVGKKNWLFVGEAGAGQRGAIIYTLIESCRRRNIDPCAYLKDALTRLPHMTTGQIPEITPEAWAKSRRASVKAA